MNMRIEAQNFIKQGKRDFITGENNIKSKDYYFAVFAFQQCAEKCLKGLWIIKKREIPKTHSIIFLSKGLNVPKELERGIRDLNPEYLLTRYPDMTSEVPYEMYTKEISENHKKTAQKILKWIESEV